MSTPPKSPNPTLNGGEDRPAIERGIAIARRNWLILLICIVLLPVLALVYSLLQTPQYTASATLLFNSSESSQALFGSPIGGETDPQRAAATNLRLVSLEQIASRTAKALDKPGLTTAAVQEKVEIAPQGESDLIAIEATDPSAKFATVLANDFARQYIDFRSETDERKITEAEAVVEAKLAEMTPEEQSGQAGENLEKRLRQLTLIATLETGNAELVQEANEPSSPSSPQTKRNIALGLLLGIILAICLALLREQFDRRLRELEDVETLFDVPILGTIPQSSAIEHTGPGAQLAPTGAEGEAFRMLRASLRYFNVDREVCSILVTSAVSQDGKTTVAWNLALAEGRAGARVLYLEADLRRPSISAELGIPGDEGLSLVLTRNSDPTGAIRSVEGVDVLVAGPIPPNPAELIESQRMSDLLGWAEENYDRVIIDTPPAAVVADAVSLFNQVGGVVAVMRLQKSPREAAEHLRDQLVNTGAPVLGLVVNGVGAPTESSYYHASPSGEFGKRPPKAAEPSSRRRSKSKSSPASGRRQT
ncbi:MAG: polysaccharide biosynthesis tyrosine autokinase [Solirubrobacterales bacterium]